MAIATLDYVKALLGINDDLSDTLLSTNIMPGVQKAIEKYIKQPLDVTAYTDYLNGPDDMVLQLPHLPIVSITSITIDPYESDPEVIDGGQIAFDSNKGQCWVLPTNSANSHYFKGSWRGIPNILATYSAGFETCPSDLQDVFALACKTRFMQVGNTSDTQTLTSEKVADWAGTYAKTIAFISQDLDVRAVLDSYKDWAGGI